MKKITILIPNGLVKGGTTRIIYDLLWFLYKSFDISLVMLEGDGFAYDTPKSVKIIKSKSIELENKYFRTINMFFSILKISKNIDDSDPSTVISFLPRANIVNVIIAKVFKKKYKAIIVEQNFNKIHYNSSFAGRCFLKILHLTYPLADLVVANAIALKEELIYSFGINRNYIKAIYSPFDFLKISNMSGEKVKHKWFDSSIPIIIHVGRLIKQKNQNLLLEAFNLVRKSNQARLIIIGDGILEEELKNKTFILGLNKYVDFLGWKDNIFKYIAKSTVFVLSSDFEGLPSVLVQAMRCGCPVVSTDCPSGPREILRDGKYGLLSDVGDEITLSQNIIDVLNDKKLQIELSKNGIERSKDFSIDNVGKEFLEIL